MQSENGICLLVTMVKPNTWIERTAKQRIDGGGWACNSCRKKNERKKVKKKNGKSYTVDSIIIVTIKNVKRGIIVYYNFC